MKESREQYHSSLQSFEVVENGPDSYDYVIKTVRGESATRISAAILQDRNAYLGYGYTIRKVA
ncbi:hypothetical protein PQD17_gp47 [Pantoea phage PdC23]|uniref:Uncharacterized protein n=1 Tax=Pantoea phage PdC23 TaxID=2894356 RepID=A0AAE8YHJ4_9CAUD|nr:hypothetical protein PQD17_gp47 [Pantoea phage PdC23]UGC97760.1 hypothetical protein pdc_047 [Pantoea phage PdC23]